MLSKLWRAFGRRPILIKGAGTLAEGMSARATIGDPFAGGTEIVVCRLDGRLHALDRLCPHEGGRIIDGPLAEGRYVVCPLHNYRFDPRDGKAVGIACERARVYRIREKGPDAEVWL